MKTTRFSLVLSLVLLSSSTYVKSTGLHGEGVALGRALCKEQSYGEHSQQDFPLVREIFKTFATYEPSAHQFKNAYSKFKAVCGGIKAAAAQSYSSKASTIIFCANTVIESQNIGQLFTKIGNKLKLLAAMPMEFQVPDNLSITPEVRFQAHTFGKQFSSRLFNMITEYSVSGNYLVALQEYIKIESSITSYWFFTRRAENDGFSLGVHIMSGCKEGLKEFPLKEKLTNVKPFKATLIRFIHSLLLSTLAIPEVVLSGGRPDINGFAQAFIDCGKKIEAIS